MPLVRFLLAAISLAGLIWVLTTQFEIKGKALPPIGHFLNPFSGFWQNAEKALPSPQAGSVSIPSISSKDILIPSLSGEVTVAMDDLGIPHIFAGNIKDALAVQGYLTAKDRLFQMDLTARKSLGRLSEIVGVQTLEVDKANIRKGLPLGVERAVAALRKSPKSLELLNAYLSGVNAWIARLSPAQYPIEYKILNAKPEFWTAHHSLAVIEGMSDVLVSRNDDIKNSRNLELLGSELYEVLFPRYNPDQTPVVPDDGQWKGIKPDLSKAKTHAKVEGVGQTFAEGAEYLANKNARTSGLHNLSTHQIQPGSNNWAISGSRTASGKPMLANDPHLNLTLPSIWYQVQLHTPESNTYGVSIPGVPGIIIGFNEHIAWGMTNVSHDVGDYYRIKWTDKNKTRYLVDGQELKAELKVYAIKVRNKPEPVLDTVRLTRFGPVQNITPNQPDTDLAYQWLPQFEPSPDLITEFLKLNQARNYDEYRASIRNFDTPAQNFVFASRTGDIALTVQGKYPIRRPQVAEFVQDGSTVANDWLGFIPNEHIPYQLNPKRGFVFSANQHSTPPSYPYPYYGYFDDYRARYLHSRIAEAQAFTTDSMSSVQLSNHLLLKDDALEAMLQMIDTSQLDAVSLSLIHKLKSWNGDYTRNSTEGVVFELWHDALYHLTFDEFRQRTEAGESVAMPDNWVLYRLLKKQPNHIIFDLTTTQEREQAQDIIRKALTDALTEYAKQTMSIKNIQTATKETVQQLLKEKGSWAAFRGMHINHIAHMSGFGRELVTDGHPNAINANSNGHGPSWRMIVDLQDSIRAIGVYPGGQSGNPGSRHFDDMLNHWAEGKYFDCLFLRSPDQKNDRIKSIIKCTRS